MAVPPLFDRVVVDDDDDDDVAAALISALSYDSRCIYSTTISTYFVFGPNKVNIR